MQKKCSRCKVIKPQENFFKSKITKSSLQSECKICHTKGCRISRNKNKIKRNAYKREWDKRNRDKATWSILKQSSRKKVILICDRNDFSEWYKLQERKCVYCDISEENTSFLSICKKSGNTLQIDRKDNKKGYLIDNLVLACPRCNLIKSDIFSFDEMREIGQQFVKPKYQKILEVLSF